MLLENAEKLAAASSALTLHLQLLPGGGSAHPQQQALQGAPPPLVVLVLAAAGQLATDPRSPEPLLPPLELFYARPSASLPALLLALGQAAGEVREQAASGLNRPGDASECAHAPGSCLRTLLTAIAAATAHHHRRLPKRWAFLAECLRLELWMLCLLGVCEVAAAARLACGWLRVCGAGVPELLAHVCSLGQLLGHVVSAVQAQQSHVAAAYRLSGAPLYRQLGAPSWLADKPARDALDGLALVRLPRSSPFSRFPGGRAR